MKLPNLTANFITQLTADNQIANHRRQVDNAHFSFVQPELFENPQLISVSENLANALNVNLAENSGYWAKVLTGQQLLTNSQPYAMNYAGHQFGNWAGQLGDGRAINLGEIVAENQQNFTLQLKGAGPTPYSRMGDGFAVLRSSIREFLCSEAMFHLGIPTTRALSLCLTGERVARDMFYDGNPQQELGAVVARVSKCFIRFGHFERFTHENQRELQQQLLDFTIAQYFPELINQYTDIQQRYLAWFEQVCQRTCQLMVQWFRVGFVHGVMNTDNMSIIGETIDYGPYGFLDEFNPSFTPNTSDTHRRYCFAKQAEIAQWNLWQLANSIYQLVPQQEALIASLKNFNHSYQLKWQQMMAAKLGLSEFTANDQALIDSLLQLLLDGQFDYTLFFRKLSKISASVPLTVEQVKRHFSATCYKTDQASFMAQLHTWLEHYQQRLQQQAVDDNQRQRQMNQVNPAFILRNYLSQQAIEKAEQGDYSELERLKMALQKPYQQLPEYAQYYQKRPSWADDKAGCSRLSCSS